MTSAQLLSVDGTRRDLTPKNGTTFEFDNEAYDLIGARTIQVCATRDGRFLLVDEDGKGRGKPVNDAATALYVFGAYDPIVGDVIVCGAHQLAS